MILFFNKQYREENGLINDLARKIKKSKTLERKTQRNAEVYMLDNATISFDILSHQLIVAERKTGERILDMSCEYAGGFTDADELQNARFHMFSNLLSVARKTYEAKVEEEEKLALATKKIQAEQARLSKAEAEKAAAEAAIVNARKRIKSL